MVYMKMIYMRRSFIVLIVSSSDYWNCINEIITTYKIDIAIVQPELVVVEWTKQIAEGKKISCKVFIART